MSNLTRRNITSAALALALLAAAGGVTASPVQQPQLQAAAVSDTITYQGQLSDAGGNPLSGSYTFLFELYEQASGGSRLWQQSKSGVQVRDGLFSVELDVDAAHFDGRALWMAITVNGQLLSPRQALTPAPYALGLRPGARVFGDLPEAALDVRNEGGMGLQGLSLIDQGVYGETEGDEDYYSAGVHGHSIHDLTSGVMGTSDSGWGVYGKITNPDNTHSAVVGYNEGQGNGVAGVSMHGSGVVGQTEDDTEYEAAGVAGYSTHDRTFGVYGYSEYGIGVLGEIDTAENDNAAVVGSNTGAGIGVYGYSEKDKGVSGRTEASDSYGGFFHNAADGGAGLYATGGGGWSPDLVLGGTTGTIYSEEPSSEIKLYSMNGIFFDLDENDDEESGFSIYNGENEAVFGVDEYGNTVTTGELYVGENIDSHGLACMQFDAPSAGLHAVDVPWFCIDALCWVTVMSDGVFGAQSAGLSWPSMYMQCWDDDTWVTGPNINIAGLSIGGGPGVNGDGNYEPFGFGGQTTGGGIVQLWDDSAVENGWEQWTVEFQPKAGELSYASLYVCPMGYPTPSFWGRDE